jgi:hypothetical protein
MADELQLIASEIRKGTYSDFTKLGNLFYWICNLPEIRKLQLDIYKRNQGEKVKKSVFVKYHQKSIGSLNIYEIFMKIKYPQVRSISGKLVVSVTNTSSKEVKDLEQKLEHLEKMKNHPSVSNAYESTKKNIEDKIEKLKSIKQNFIRLCDCLIVSEKVMSIMGSDNYKQMNDLLYKLYNSPTTQTLNQSNQLNKTNELNQLNKTNQLNQSNQLNKTNESNQLNKTNEWRKKAVYNSRWNNEPKENKKQKKKEFGVDITSKNTMGSYGLGDMIIAKLQEKKKENGILDDKGWTTVKNKVYVPPKKREEKTFIPFNKFSSMDNKNTGYLSIASQLKMKKQQDELLNPENFPSLNKSIPLVASSTYTKVWNIKDKNKNNDNDNDNDNDDNDLNWDDDSKDSDIMIHESKTNKTNKINKSNTKQLKNTKMRCFTKDKSFEPICVEKETGKLILLIDGIKKKMTIEELQDKFPNCFTSDCETADEFMNDYETYGNTFNTEVDDYIYIDIDKEIYYDNSDYDSYDSYFDYDSEEKLDNSNDSCEQFELNNNISKKNKQLNLSYPNPIQNIETEYEIKMESLTDSTNTKNISKSKNKLKYHRKTIN